MDAEPLLRQISQYCREARMAESTFGRLAVNDGKFVGRLRAGGRTTSETDLRVRAFMAAHPAPATAAADALPPLRNDGPAPAPTG